MTQPLVTLDVTGRPRYWFYDSDKFGITYIHYGFIGGTDRAKAVTLAEAIKEYSNKLNDGYKICPEESLVEFLNKYHSDKDYNAIWFDILYFKTDSSNYKKHMLAQYYKDDKFDVTHGGYIAQPKLNGLRAWLVNLEVTIGEGTLFQETKRMNLFISRGTGEIYYLPHITDSITIPPDVWFDGEIYKHGVPLNIINSSTPRLQLASGAVTNVSNSEILEYHCYDIGVRHRNFINREKDRYILKHDQIKIVENLSIANTNPDALLRRLIDEGYEGVMFREARSLYYFGHRVSCLLKYKEKQTGMFVLADINKNEKGEIIGVFINDLNDSEFEATFKVDKETANSYYDNKETYKGRIVQVTYIERSGVANVPFHGNAEKI